MSRLGRFKRALESSEADANETIIHQPGTTARIWAVQDAVGEIKIWSEAAMVSDLYMPCDGRTLDSVANTNYALIYGVIGTTYGGTGPDAFNLPDLRGRVPVGADDMGGVAAGVQPGVTRGTASGSSSVALTSSQMVAHTHALTGTTDTKSNHTHSSSHSHYLNIYTGGSGTPIRVDANYGGAISYGTALTETDTTNTTTTGDHPHGVVGTTGASGDGTPVSLLQPSLGVLYVIKVL